MHVHFAPGVLFDLPGVDEPPGLLGAELEAALAAPLPVLEVVGPPSAAGAGSQLAPPARSVQRVGDGGAVQSVPNSRLRRAWNTTHTRGEWDTTQEHNIYGVSRLHHRNTTYYTRGE